MRSNEMTMAVRPDDAFSARQIREAGESLRNPIED
jgi:hypothetical protein